MAIIHLEDMGFDVQASGEQNRVALQKALDIGGTVVVTKPGTYDLSDTVFIHSNTSLTFGYGVFIKKVNEHGEFTHVILNKGALTKTYDEHIEINNLCIIVNKIDVRNFLVFGLHGQLAFFYVKDVKIRGFRCFDLGEAQYGIHICTFEDAVVEDAVIKGNKDGIHFGRGKRFLVRNCVFKTFDDAIALNGHDYDVGNPEIGWIENGTVENCHDLTAEKTTGFFCRILAGAWVDWREGMVVQKSDTVVSCGRMYRVRADADGKQYVSVTRPTHEKGEMVLDGICWVVIQTDVVYTAGVRNVTFRNIFLEKARLGFAVYFDKDRFSRSYYPGAKVPGQENLVFDNIRILHKEKQGLLRIDTPIDLITVSSSTFYDNMISFGSNEAMEDYQKTSINIYGCSFTKEGDTDFLMNNVPDKEIQVKMSSNIALHDDMKLIVHKGNGNITVTSDLPMESVD